MTSIELSECGNYIKQGMLLYKREYSRYGKHFEHCLTMDGASIEQMITAYEQQSRLVDEALDDETETTE